MKNYDHKKIERKWQTVWKDTNLYATKEGRGKKSYVLDMFPYPSGDGLHVGHPKGYIATDVYSRMKRMQGYSILHPMGWDAFGLPAENYAIKNKVHPSVAVKKNIKRFKGQLEKIGFNYDWEREINTTDPNYYKWTQWIFLQMFKSGLAYQSSEPINWCPSCQTGLANEDLEDSKCERCGSVVEKKAIPQWVLRITKYADRLLSGLDGLSWPEYIKESQRNWIGRSEGAEIRFMIYDLRFKKEIGKVTVFTTRPDTLFGATYMVLAPEHPFVVEHIRNPKSEILNKFEIQNYVNETKAKTEIERTAEGREKTGVELKGIKAVNPATKEEIPIWIADYVLADYGTGAIMAVPAHDERDFQFATKYRLPIRMVVCPHYPAPTCPVLDAAYVGDGHLVDSGKFDGMTNAEAKKEITKFVGGKTSIKYKLRDWVFSRQRYWGEPIPLVHCPKCGVVPVPEKDLPVKLPNVKSYEPAGTGESPLAKIEKWVNVKCPKCKGPGKRETNTMPQWAGSCWYHLAYIVKQTKSYKLKTKSSLSKWLPVDMYVGGAEHATRHLIYARFWHKFLYDIGVVGTDEPFTRLQNVGLILASDGKKMSKRYGNVVNPDDVVERFGADSLRAYEMFVGPFNQSIAWSTDSLVGAHRFLERVWRIRFKIQDVRLKERETEDVHAAGKVHLTALLHQTIKKVGDDIEGFRFNTAVSALMILLNAMEKEANVPSSAFKIFIHLLAPFAPHLAEEMWSKLGYKKSIHLESWPTYDAAAISAMRVTIVVQVGGKPRATFEAGRGESENRLKEVALSLPQVKKWVEGKELARVIVVPNKLVSIVLKGE